MPFTFRIPNVIITGVDSHKELHQLIELANHKSAIIISDGIKVRPEVEKTITANLNSIGIKTVEYNELGMSVGHIAINEISEIAADADVDLIVSVGGRYSMHAGRLAAMLRTNKGNILDYTEASKITEHPATFAAIATTSSSGAAISPCVCYNNEETRERICFAEPKLLPSIAILDPGMTSWLSPKDIASDGMISFGYAIEALASELATPVTDSCALEAVHNLVSWLPLIYSNSNNMEYRERLMFTQQLVSMASSNVYANMICKIAGQVESMTHISMGNTVAALLPIMIERFEQIIPDKMEMLAKSILRADESLNYGGSGTTADLMRSVISRLDMPLKLSFLGLEEAHVENMVNSLTDEAMKTNAPVQYDRDAVRKILLSAL